ncbi:T9SS type A sorting domain-containing protein [Alkaliflexus imshenetskii]|uniref:T9SS type A sorting domain-containing protein n=1 Tax=Alkaliflexus imshenetskii TaxID=286730 RepID=UPI00047A02B4
MFKIHPIPASNYLIIEHDKPQVTIQVYNAFGMGVINQTLLGNVLDVSMLPAGVYILKMENQTTKFIKQ